MEWGGAVLDGWETTRSFKEKKGQLEKKKRGKRWRVL